MNLGEVNYIIGQYLSDKLPDFVISPGELGRLLHVAQLKHFAKKIGLPEEYRPGMPIPSQAFELTKRITDDLAPFKVLMGGDNPAMSINDDGDATLPSDFFFPSSVSYKYVKDNGDMIWKEVELVTDKEWIKRLASHIKRPSVKYPIANIYGNKVRFYPVTLGFVDFLYLKTPTAPVFGVNYDRGFLEYNPATSTELEWDDVNTLSIIAVMLGDLGISVDNNSLVAISEKARTTGT